MNDELPIGFIHVSSNHGWIQDEAGITYMFWNTDGTKACALNKDNYRDIIEIDTWEKWHMEGSNILVSI